MNTSAKFQLYHQYSFRGVDFFNIFSKISLLVAMTSNQIQRFGQNGHDCLVEDHPSNIS